MLSMLAENIDFAELCGALLGRMSSAEMKGVVNNILSVFDMVKVHGGFTKEVRDAWRGIREELHMEREEQRKQRESRVPEQRKEGNSEAEPPHAGAPRTLAEGAGRGAAARGGTARAADRYSPFGRR